MPILRIESGGYLIVYSKVLGGQVISNIAARSGATGSFDQIIFCNYLNLLMSSQIFYLQNGEVYRAASISLN